jgi:hypothetical protein
MRSSVLFSLATLGISAATLAAPSAQAQLLTRTIICRDGSKFETNNAAVCNRHRGVDGRATEEARRAEERSANGRWDDRRDGRDERRDGRDDRRDGRDGRDDRWDDRRNDDPRYDPNGRNDRGYGYGGRREVYEFTGVVDKEIQIQLRGNRAWVQPIGAGEDRFNRGRMISGLPQQTGNLVVQRLEGRGDVDVIEQPSSRNGYTATLRIRDPRSGAARYRIVAYWEPPVRFGYGR